MTTRIRDSKVRTLYGEPAKTQDVYNGILHSAPGGAEFNPLRTNSQLFAFPWTSSGQVAVVNHKNVGALSDSTPRLEQDENVSDLAFNPFHENVLAIGGQTMVNVWKLPEYKTTEGMTPEMQLKDVHAKRLLSVDFHPLAENTLITSAVDKQMKFWDLNSQSEKLSLNVHEGFVTSQSWNYEGSMLATASKDKKLRIIDPRAGSVTAETVCHEGAKSSRCLWIPNTDQVLTCGFKKGTPEREIAFFDIRNLQQGRLAQVTIDNVPSSMFPHFDPDLKIMYLIGKGDGNIRIFEITKDALPIHQVGEFRSAQSQAGFAFMPKLSCEIMKCEVARMLKIQGNSIVPIRFFVQRSNAGHIFQPDIYPDTFDRKPVYSPDSWFSGDVKTPNLVPVEPPDM